MKFIVLWKIAGNNRVHSMPFITRDDAQIYCRQLQQRQDITYYANHRIGEKLDSFENHNAKAIS